MIGPLGGPFSSYGFGWGLQVRPPALSIPASLLPRSSPSSLGVLVTQFVDSVSALDQLELGSRMRLSAVGGGSGTARAASSSVLGLVQSATPSTLTSTEEVNTTPTSYDPKQPSFSGSSTTQPDVGGTYDGAQGDDTLTFTVAGVGGVVGLANLQLDVTDGSGNPVETVTFAIGEGAGTTKTLSNGLTLSLSSGFAAAGDSFQVNVSVSQGTSVDPDAALDGTGKAAAGLDDGQSVTAGTFQVNGAVVAVKSGDSLNDVLAAISSSSAGVSASYDATTDSVILTSVKSGPGKIALSNDTTGFLDAVKLSGAVTAEGSPAEDDSPLADVAAFAGIQSGTLLVDSIAITIDVLTDSIHDVADAINAADAGVTASYDESQDRFLVVSSDGQGFELDDGTSGFFTGVDVTTGTYEASSRPTSYARTLQDDAAFLRTLEDLADSIETLFGEKYGLAASYQSRNLSREIEDAVRDALEGAGLATTGDVLDTELGITFRFDSGEPAIEVDRARLAKAVEDDPEALATLLLGDDSDDASGGLLAGLRGAFDDFGESLLAVLDPSQSTGLAISLSA